jgi:hypothetical protein
LICLPQPNISSCVTFVGLFNLIELKIKGGVLGQISGPGQLLDQRQELMVVAPVIVELNLTNKLDLDALVLEPACFAV